MGRPLDLRIILEIVTKSSKQQISSNFTMYMYATGLTGWIGQEVVSNRLVVGNHYLHCGWTYSVYSPEIVMCVLSCPSIGFAFHLAALQISLCHAFTSKVLHHSRFEGMHRVG